MEDGNEEPLNILLVQPGDVRHIIKTISSRRRHSKRALNFFIFDKPVECIARHLLLLQVLHDWALPVRQRANVWLEIYGNSLVQERTEKYIEAKGKELIDLLCNETGAMQGVVDLGMLKFKERDELEDVFKAWSVKREFKVEELRDTRMRAMYGQRFDSKRNLIDWDYRQAYKKVEAMGIVHIKQYRGWRDTGVAFEFGDQTYTMPNRSMASYCEGRSSAGVSKMMRGFWLDLTVSPFIALGIHSDTPNTFASNLYTIQSKNSGTEQWRHNGVEIAVYNCLAWMHEIETGTPYMMRQDHKVYSGLGDKIAKEEESRPEPETLIEALAGDGEEEEGKKKKEKKREGKKKGKNTKNTTGAGAGADSDGDDDGDESIFDVDAPQPGSPTARAKAKERAKEEVRVRVEHEEAMHRAQTIVQSMAGVKVKVLSGKLFDLCRKKSYHQKFQKVVLSTQSVHLLQHPELIQLVAKGGEVQVESPKFVHPLTEDQMSAYTTKVHEYATSNNLEALFTGDPCHITTTVKDRSCPVPTFSYQVPNDEE